MSQTDQENQHPELRCEGTLLMLNLGKANLLPTAVPNSVSAGSTMDCQPATSNSATPLVLTSY